MKTQILESKFHKLN